ncbi:MAG: Ldh family oxidoreductase [Anaerolineae bacterium]
MKIRVDDLKNTTLKVLARSGYPTDEAETILDVLMYAQLRGNNQGVVKLIGAGMPRDPNCTPITVTRDTKVSALVDGGHNSGMVVVQYALELAMKKAEDHGFGIVGTNNTNSSTGAIGYYASKATEAGYIGLIFAGSGEYVAMHGAYEPIFGTNPLAIGIPTQGKPVVFDMATSAIARFGIVEAKTAGRSIPDDVAYDNDGNATTDPAAALGGAIRAFGGYKGAALAFMVEVLTHELVGTTHDAQGKKVDWGNLIMVIDPELLVDRDTFAKQVSELVMRVKATRKLPGIEEILIPGERGNAVLDAALASGEIEIEEGLWMALQKATS